MANPRHVFKAEGNAWIQQLEDQIVLGPSHVFEYIKTDGYKRSVKKITNKIITSNTGNNMLECVQVKEILILFKFPLFPENAIFINSIKKSCIA